MARFQQLNGFLWYGFPVLMAGVMPVNPRFTSYVYILWCVFALIARWMPPPTAVPHETPRGWGWVLGTPVILYLAHGGAMLWTDNWSEGWFQLESKLALLVTPWLAWETLRRVQGEARPQLWRSLAWAFVVGWCVHMSWVWIRFLGFVWRHEWPLPWRYQKLASPFHPSYAAFYLLWAGLLLVLLTSQRNRGLRWLLLPWSAHLGLLASKAGWVLGAGFWVLAGQRYRTWKQRLLIAASLALLIGLGGLAGSKRVSEWVGWMAAQELGRSEGLEPGGAPPVPAKTGSTGGRVQAWKGAWGVLWEHPGGVGPGDATQVLDAAYRDSGFDYALKKHLNPHNQWLQWGVSLGWFGLLLLVFWWSLWGWIAWKNSKPMLLILLVMISLNALFESVLELQAGVVFVVFWSCFGLALEPRHPFPWPLGNGRRRGNQALASL